MKVKIKNQEQAKIDVANKTMCPNCGSTEVVYNIDTESFTCNFCRSVFTLDKLQEGSQNHINSIDDVDNLNEIDVSEGLVDIDNSEGDTDVISGRCPSCGATLTIGKDSDTSAVKCHWCRSVIHFDTILGSGATPDVIIPFKVSKERAKELIQNGLKKKKFFANKTFIREFNIDNIKPVYLPYMICDYKAKDNFKGLCGERTRKYEQDKNTYYDFNVYWFEREYDLSVNDLFIEANSRYIKHEGVDYTKDSLNIINSILPFKLEEAVKYDPKFLIGDYRAEFRDMNKDEIEKLTKQQLEKISMNRCKETIKSKLTTHGIKFRERKHDLQGAKYISALCPVWLYSYLDKKGNLNYIAVNAQTEETASCVPVNNVRLLAISSIIEAVVFVSMIGILLISG